MSRIGTLVLALTESAEALGFSTIEDAINAGYEVVYTADPRNAYLKRRA